MINKQRQKDYKKPLTIALVTLSLICLVLLALELTNTTHIFHTSKVDQEKAASAKADLNRKKVLTTTGSTNTSDGSKQAPSTGTYAPPSSSDSIIFSAQQSSPNTVTLITKLYGYSDGICDLTITNQGATYKKSASVIYQSEFSTCAGFSIPVSSLNTGIWNINLSVTSAGITQTKTTTFEVK